MKKTKTNILNITILVVLLLILAFGASFAFFTAQITGGESATTITVSGGTMNITYNGGSAINVANIYPRAAAWATKTFTITGNNTTAIVMNYKVTLVVQTNTFTSGVLEYRLASTNTGANGTPIPAIDSNTDIASGASNILLGTGSFTAATGGNKVHTYTLSIYFVDTGVNQNTEQNKSFTGYLKTEAA